MEKEKWVSDIGMEIFIGKGGEDECRWGSGWECKNERDT